MLATAILGVGIIGISVMVFPMFGDVIDEATTRNGIRQESFYTGFRSLFARFAIIIQATTFGLIHIFMGFEPGSSTQSPRAILGLRIQLALVPMLIMTIGLILFWKLYDLTPERKKLIQAKLKELKL
jgi:Na+/melibiose symporter-like transporter